MIRAILFDVDGVLLDSAAANAEFFREFFRRISGALPAGAELPSNNHLSLDATLRRVYPQATADDIQRWVALSDTIEAGAELLRPIPGVLEVIPQLSKVFQLGIVTNRIKPHLVELWRVVPYEADFSAIAAFEDTQEHKPHPEPLLYALKKLRVSPPEAVFIGDAKSDLQAGQAAGVRVIILGTEQWPGALATVNSLLEIPALLQTLT